MHKREAKKQTFDRNVVDYVIDAVLTPFLLSTEQTKEGNTDEKRSD